MRPVYIVDKDVPIPPKRVEWYPWERLQVGDSFAVPTPTEKEDRSVRSCASVASRRLGWKFTVRRTAPKQVRVWRVK
jgi:hypothetical protein